MRTQKKLLRSFRRPYFSVQANLEIQGEAAKQ